jgi:hypothetical protein
VKVRFFATLVFCVASIALAACGGDGTSSSSTGATGATGASGSSDTAATTENRMRDALAQGGVTGTDADCVINDIQSNLSADEIQKGVEAFDSTGKNTPGLSAAIAAATASCDVKGGTP